MACPAGHGHHGDGTWSHSPQGGRVGLDQCWEPGSDTALEKPDRPGEVNGQMAPRLFTGHPHTAAELAPTTHSPGSAWVKCYTKLVIWSYILHFSTPAKKFENWRLHLCKTEWSLRIYSWRYLVNIILPFLKRVLKVFSASLLKLRK